MNRFLVICIVGVVSNASIGKAREYRSVELVSPNITTAIDAFSRSSHQLMEIGRGYLSESARQQLIFPDPIALLTTIFQRIVEFFFGSSDSDSDSGTTTTTTTTTTTGL